MADQINRLIKSGAEGVFLVANAPEGAMVVKEMASREPSERLPIYSHWGLANGDFVKMAGIDNILLTNIKVLQSYSFLSENTQQKSQTLLQAYRHKFDNKVTAETIPSAVGVIHAYDLLHLLAIAVNKAGTTESSAVRQALENIESYQGAFKHFKYPFTASRHDALTRDDYIMAQYNKDGYLIPIEK